jgi:hypothetical protein
MRGPVAAFAIALALAGLAAPSAQAQDIEQETLPDLLAPPESGEETPGAQEARERAVEAMVAERGALLRALDKIAGQVVDFELAPGQTRQLGRILVTLGECRFPVGNPAGDAFAWLEIRNMGETEPVFRGWMIASSPALNALDHSRYDVWVLRCITP